MRDKKTFDLPNAAGNVIGPPSLPFLVLFGLLFVLITHFLGNMLPDIALGWMMQSTAFLVVRFLRVLGLIAVQEGIRVVLPGFAMKVNLECTAVHYLGIFWVGILAYPRQRIAYKFLGLAAGTVLIVFLNIARIGMVGIIGMHSPNLAVFVHTYLWQGMFAVIVLLLWIVWIKGPSHPDTSAIRFVVTFLIVAALAVVVLEVVMAGYVRLLAFFASHLLSALPRTAGMFITASGDSIQYIAGTRLYSYAVSTDILDASTFFALMAASWGKGKLAFPASRIAGGAAILSVTHVLLVTTIGPLAFTLDQTALSDLFWIIRSVSVLVPIMLWLILGRTFHGDPEKLVP